MSRSSACIKRDTCVPWHNGSPNWGPLPPLSSVKPLNTIELCSVMGCEGFQGLWVQDIIGYRTGGNGPASRTIPTENNSGEMQNLCTDRKEKNISRKKSLLVIGNPRKRTLFYVCDVSVRIAVISLSKYHQWQFVGMAITTRKRVKCLELRKVFFSILAPGNFGNVRFNLKES